MLETTIHVRFSELDPYGHVNHVVFLAYFEQGRVDLLEATGWGLETLRAHDRGVVVLEAQVRYRAPAHYGDVLTVHTEIEQLRPASSWWTQRITRDDTLIATARVRGGSVDLEGRPAKPPARMLASLREFAPAGV